MLSLLTSEQINDLPRLRTTGINTSGNLYIYENMIIKIYNAYDYECEQNIDRLLSKTIDGNYTWPLEKVYFNDRFYGVVLNYYKDYYSFGYFLSDNKVTLEQRIILCKKFIKELKNLHNNGIVHGDLHLENIITNGSDIVIADLDYVIFESDEKFNLYLKNERIESLVVCLSFISGVDLINLKQFNFPEISWVMFLRLLGVNKELIDFVYNMQKGNNIYFDEYLNCMSDNQLKTQIQRIKK